MTRNELKEIFGVIQAVFPHWVVTKATFDVWGAIVGKCSVEQAQAAVIEYLSEAHGFAPTPGQIFQRIKRMEIEKHVTAEDAWRSVLAVASHYHQHKRAELMPAARAVAERIGWQRIAMADVVKDLPWLMKEFTELYNAKINDEVTHGTMPNLQLPRGYTACIQNEERANAGRTVSAILQKLPQTQGNGETNKVMESKILSEK